MVSRGQIWWAELSDPVGSEPGFRRPVLILQADSFNKSRVSTVIAAAITSNLNLANAPGNVKLTKSKSGLTKDSVVNISQIVTIDKSTLAEVVGNINRQTMHQVDEGLRLVLNI